MNIIIRFLEDEEFHKLESVFKSYGDELPKPELSKIVVAETEDGSIVGFTLFTLVPIVTMWIEEDYRHNGLWKEMVDLILPLTDRTRTYVVATKLETEEMCKKMGLKVLENPVYVKDVEV